MTSTFAPTSPWPGTLSSGYSDKAAATAPGAAVLVFVPLAAPVRLLAERPLLPQSVRVASREPVTSRRMPCGPLASANQSKKYDTRCQVLG